jgi:hypothetical protein
MPATYLYLPDTGLATWQIGVTDQGFVTEPVSVAYQFAPPITLQDMVSGAWFTVGVSSAGGHQYLTLTAAAPCASCGPYVMEAPGGTVYQLLLNGGMLGALPFTPGPSVVFFPKIIWPSGGGNVVLFTSWPRFVPAPTGAGATVMDYQAAGPRNVFSAGQVQFGWRRTDRFYEGVMDFVQAGNDVNAWFAFMLYALGQYGNSVGPGGDFPFDFYPQGNSPIFSTYVVEDDEWKPEWRKMPGYYTFPLKWRLYVAP